MRQTADVVVIGGGIVGCSAAYYLAKRGLSVTLLERGDVAIEQSGRNWGFVRQQGRHPYELPLMIEGNAIWQNLESELEADIEWFQGGNLGLAVDEERLARFEEWQGLAREHGLDTRILAPGQVRELIPLMRGQWAGAMYTPSDGHADPTKATRALARAAVRAGATIRTNCAVEEILLAGGRVTGVHTEVDEIQSNHIVCAAGAWSTRLARSVGLRLPQRSVRATVQLTSPAPKLTESGVWADGVSFRQRRDGRLVVAGGGGADYDVTLELFRHARQFLPSYWKNRSLFRFHVGRPLLRDVVAGLPGTDRHAHPYSFRNAVEPPPNRTKARLALERFRELFPSLGSIETEQTWAGYIDATPDAVPVIDALDSPRGFIFATGFSGHGFALGPIAGRLVSELIVDGKPSLDIRGLRFSRFAENDLAEPRAVL